MANAMPAWSLHATSRTGPPWPTYLRVRPYGGEPFAKRFRRDPLFSGWQQFHVRAPGLFPARRESGCGNHVRCPGGPRLRRHLRQSEARTRLVQLAYPAAAEPVLTIRATIGTSLTGRTIQPTFD